MYDGVINNEIVSAMEDTFSPPWLSWTLSRSALKVFQNP